MQQHRSSILLKISLFLGFLFSLGQAPSAQTKSDNIRIVTDIAPIHSIATMVFGQQAQIDLLVPPSQSPHSFSLKPSQIRVMNQATLIIILSDDFTPGLSRNLRSIDSDALVLKLNDPRTNERNGEHGRAFDDRGSNNKLFQAHHRESHANDEHTWLDPRNAVQWIDLIASSAMRLDEKNAANYLLNAARAKAELTNLHDSLTQQLRPVQSASYIVYHDAYQHFAHSFDLQKPIAIALSDARAPGAKKLRAMRLKAENTKCVFSEELHDDIIVDTVTEDLSVERAILDPIGSTIPLGPNHYPQLMRNMADTFVACLT